MWNPLTWNPFRRKESFAEERYADPSQSESEITGMISEDAQGLVTPSEATKETEEAREFEPVEDGRTLMLKKIVRGILLALTVLMPIFFLPWTVPNDILTISKQLLLYVAVFIAMILWLVIIIRQGGVVLRRSGLEMGVLIFLGAWLLASIFSIQPLDSFIAGLGFITWAGFALLVFLFPNFFEKDEIPKLVNFFLLGSFLALLLGILNIFGAPIFKWLFFYFGDLTIGKQFNTVGSLTAFGGLAALTFIIAAGQYFLGSIKTSEIKIAGKWSWLWSVSRFGAIMLSAILLVILNWWTLFAALALGMLVIVVGPAIIGKIIGRKIELRAINVMGPLIILILILLLILGGRFANFNFPGVGKLTPEVSLSQNDSFEIAKKTINEKPVFGFGPDNFDIAYDNFRPKAINLTNLWNTHFSNSASELMNIAIAGGIIVLLGFLVFLFFIFKKSFRKEDPSVDGDPDGREAIATWTILPAFIAGIFLLGWQSFDITLYFTFWFLVATLAISSKRENNELKIAINNSSLPAILTSLGFVFLLAPGLIGGYLLAQKYTGEVYFAEAQRLALKKGNNDPRVLSMIENAQNKSQGDLRYLNGLNLTLISRINKELNNKTDPKNEVAKRLQDLVKKTLDTADTITKKYKNNPDSWFSIGLIYESLDQVVNGADDAAVGAFREYIKRTPNDPAGYLKIGTISLNRADRNNLALADAKQRKLNIKNEKEVVNMIISDYKNAEESFKKVVELKPDYAIAYYNLGVIYERQNRLPEAIKQLEPLAAAQSGNPSLAFELGLLYYRNGQKDKAFQEMARAVGLFKDYSNARWYLALMLEEQGKMPEAIAQLQEILKLDVNKDNQIVIDKIASLEAGQREIPPAKVTSKKPL